MSQSTRSATRSSNRAFDTRRLGWYLTGLIILLAVLQVGIAINTTTGQLSMIEWTTALGFRLTIPVTFSILGALILQRQPDNRVGWLMMVVALGTVNPAPLLIEHFYPSPQTLTLGLWLLVWLDGWSWIPFIFPIFLIPLHFPSGRPPSPRWNWVNRLALGMWLFFLSLSAFSETLGPLESDWRLPNPLGFIPMGIGEQVTGSIWVLGLLTLVIASVSSLFVRYRHAEHRERQQIKWLLYAGAMFAGFYSLTAVFANLRSEDSVWFNLFLGVSVLSIPVAIAIAILRHRLYDIDLLIRRTLQYTLVTGLLALVYLGGITILQGLFTTVSGQQSSLAIALSTLGIAALFNPLRKRIQEFIDRRFYRRKYDAEQALAGFATTARNETDLECLTGKLTSAVQETLQPESVTLWLFLSAGRIARREP